MTSFILKFKAAFILFFCLFAHANTSVGEVALLGSEISYDKSLIIVHPFSDWDIESAAKPAVDDLIRFHKNLGSETIYVLDGHGTKGLYLEDPNPTLFIDAPAGQFSDVLLGKTFFFAGGSWSFCLSNAMTSTISNTVALDIAFTVFTDASFEFMQKENMAEYFSALTKDTREKVLLAHFENIVKRATGPEICMTIYYDGKSIGKTSGPCRRTGKVYLERFSQE